MSKHTPGPWIVYAGDEWTDGIVTLEGYNAGGEPMYWTVASYNRRRDEAEANARLIAAAPDMLNALLDLVALLPDPELDVDEVQREYALAAKAAIAKATGEFA